MKIEINQMEAAVEQLDWAIRLFIDHQVYSAAITLAGAAEEILGNLVQRNAHTTLTQELASDYGMTTKEISDRYLNNARNWLKHLREGPPGKALIEDAEVITMIVRALSNLVIFDKRFPSEGPRFINWLEENKPELLENCQKLRSICQVQ